MTSTYQIFLFFLHLSCFCWNFGNQGQSWEPVWLPWHSQHHSHGKDLRHLRAIHRLQVWHPNPENWQQLQSLHVSVWLRRGDMWGDIAGDAIRLASGQEQEADLIYLRKWPHCSPPTSEPRSLCHWSSLLPSLSLENKPFSICCWSSLCFHCKNHVLPPLPTCTFPCKRGHHIQPFSKPLHLPVSSCGNQTHHLPSWTHNKKGEAIKQEGCPNSTGELKTLSELVAPCGVLQCPTYSNAHARAHGTMLSGGHEEHAAPGKDGLNLASMQGFHRHFAWLLPEAYKEGEKGGQIFVQVPYSSSLLCGVIREWHESSTQHWCVWKY